MDSFRPYYLVNALSIDVALGTGVLSLVLGRYLGFRVPVSILLILVLTVWLIYTVDHLIDAKAIKGQATSFRHHFHQHFFKQITAIAIVVFVAILFLVTQIPPVTVFYGIPVFLGVAAYFVLHRFFNLSFQKEMLIAVLYVLGVFIGPYSLRSEEFGSEVYLLLVQLALMAWTNLLIFGLFEIDEDKSDKLKSTALTWGEGRTSSFIKGLLVLTFLVGVAGLILNHQLMPFLKLQIVFFFMNGVLGVLLFRKDSIAEHGLQYRYFGDGIFFMPVAYFWF